MNHVQGAKGQRTELAADTTCRRGKTGNPESLTKTSTMSTTDAIPIDAQDRPCSIDLTLELERQLDNESLPSTPADAQRPQSLDPQVLAHIITNLRLSVSEATRHRDELAQSLAEIQARERDLTDTLAHMTDKCSTLQEELDTAKSKAKDDENTISVLRTKVEESRYVALTPRADWPSTFPLYAQAGTHAPSVRESKAKPGPIGIGSFQG